MGLLSYGTPLSWEEATIHREYVRKHGIKQFLNTWNALKDRTQDCLKWGDEIEYILVRFVTDSDGNKRAILSLRAHELLETLQQDELNDPGNVDVLWRPEYGSYMLEATPGHPYGGTIRDFMVVQPNMRLRRERAQALLRPDERLMSLTCFPLLGVPGFLESGYKPYGPVAKSLFIADECINPHPRFPTLTRNIRVRRGSRVAINVPIYHDKNTSRPYVERFDNDDGEAAANALPDHIYLDAMCFGMGCCCLQVTFQACNVNEARHLYDQLATVCPILLALSAAAPIFRGKLADIDCRWNVIAGSVDDRTLEERGLSPLQKNRHVINKSRYDSIDCYISRDSSLKPEYNDIDLVYDAQLCEELEDNGIDTLLARHIAHLFIRDPLVIFSERVELDDARETDHFENIQSTNWQTVRFKPPPPNSDIGWRVEFRAIEIQITDFENAAFTAFIVLLTRTILSFNLNFYVPLSKVDENMQTAHQRDALRNGLFYFRKAPTSMSSSFSNCTAPVCCNNTSDPDAFELMSIDTIINGKEGGFSGLLPLIKAYMSSLDMDIETGCRLSNYMNLISKRASGELVNSATWQRQFVQSHPDYKNDSVVSDVIQHDLLKAMDDLASGKKGCSELLGKFTVD